MTVNNVLIVGGGFTGFTSAIALAERGVRVTLVERAPAWARVGHGLTIQGNALRVFRELGVLDDILARSAPEDRGIDLVLAKHKDLLPGQLELQGDLIPGAPPERKPTRS